MNAVVVYYSLEGNTEMIAKQIAEQTGADLIKLQPVKEFSKEDVFKKYFLGGMSVVFKQKPKLVNETLDLDRYDTIIIGTPVWAGGCSSPVYSALCKNKFANKNVGLFACHASENAGKCFEKLTPMLQGNTVKATTSFESPKKADAQQVKEKVERFCTDIAR